MPAHSPSHGTHPASQLPFAAFAVSHAKVCHERPTTAHPDANVLGLGDADPPRDRVAPAAQRRRHRPVQAVAGRLPAARGAWAGDLGGTRPTRSAPGRAARLITPA